MRGIRLFIKISRITKDYFLYFNFNARIRITAQDAKFNPVTISSNKSETTNNAYKKVIAAEKVQII